MVAASSVAATAAASGSAVPPELILGSPNDENGVQIILVKFSFKNPALIPAGIPQVDRQPSYQLDVARQLAAFNDGQDKLAREGRVRKGRVDTGVQVIQLERPVHAGFLRRGIANRGFRMTHLHYFKQTPDPKKDPRGQQEPMYVVVACFVRHHDAPKPEAAHVAALRELAAMTWNKCFVWDNPNRLATINFVGRAPNQKPKYSIVVRDGNVAAEAVQEALTEEQE
jgi:hypothetical protein